MFYSSWVENEHKRTYISAALAVTSVHPSAVVLPPHYFIVLEVHPCISGWVNDICRIDRFVRSVLPRQSDPVKITNGHTIPNPLHTDLGL